MPLHDGWLFGAPLSMPAAPHCARCRLKAPSARRSLRAKSKASPRKHSVRTIGPLYGSSRRAFWGAETIRRPSVCSATELAYGFWLSRLTVEGRDGRQRRRYGYCITSLLTGESHKPIVIGEKGKPFCAKFRAFARADIEAAGLSVHLKFGCVCRRVRRHQALKTLGCD